LSHGVRHASLAIDGVKSKGLRSMTSWHESWLQYYDSER